MKAIRYLGGGVALLLFVFSATVLVYSQSGMGTGTVAIDALVLGCGDGLIGIGEDCDTTNLNGQTCATQGFNGGTLSCTASCVFNTTACTSGGGGGGGGGSSATKGAQVVLTGRAYPRSTVSVLKDAQIVATTVAGSDARFQVGVQKLSAGSYIFSVYSEDAKGIRSSLLTFPVAVSKNALTKIENIFIAPTIDADKREVRRGDPLIIFGQSTPSASITLEVNSDEPFFFKTLADAAGAYLHTLDTTLLEMGQHHARSRGTFAGAISSQSTSVGFTVGTKNVLADGAGKCPAKADFNRDCRVNLLDYSIAAYWYHRTLSPEFAAREKEMVNGDGVINLVDFSIMAFYWTG